MTYRIHMIEPSGRGGIFQHALALSQELSRAGVGVVLHTATDLEQQAPGVTLCLCFRWHRTSASRRMRQLRTTGHVLGMTLPHLFNAIRSSDVVHIQGFFGLTPELISVARARNATVVSSPHNTFVRDGAVGGGRALTAELRRSDGIFVYSESDVAQLAAMGVASLPLPLVQWLPPVDADTVSRWNQELRVDGGHLALMPGQVRADKRPDLFVRAINGLTGWRGAVIGEDLGIGSELVQLIEALEAPVTTHYRYLDLSDFAALISAADVVVAPYAVASQSGVLAVAKALGVPTAVTPTGGLLEMASAVADDDSPEAVGRAIVAAHKRGASAPNAGAVVEQYLRGYEQARRSRRG